MPHDDRRHLPPSEPPAPSLSVAPSLSDAELAELVVVDAGRLARRLREEGLAVHRKTSVSDVVTQADTAAERRVAELLAAYRPGDGVLGEEGTLVAARGGTDGTYEADQMFPGDAGDAGDAGADDDTDDANTDDDEAGARRRWVVDPVDGTYNFVTGSDYWCSAVALSSGRGQGAELLGAVHRPVTDETFVGGTGVPTRRNGVPVDRLTPGDLATGSLATYLHPPLFGEPAVAEPFTRLARGAATIRMLGSGSVDLAAVACGVHAVWCQHSCPEWDWLPGRALVEGAGGRCLTVEVDGYTWFVAGRPRAVDQAADLLRG